MTETLNNTDYQKAVDLDLEKRCGITYTELVEMAPSLDPNGKMMRRAPGRGIGPATFARNFALVHSLAPASHNRAREINLRLAALNESATGSDHWVMDNKGDAYAYASSADGTILRINVDRTSGQLFSAYEAEGNIPSASRDPLGRILQLDQKTSFIPLAEDVDLNGLLEQIKLYRPQISLVEISELNQTQESAGFRV